MTAPTTDTIAATAIAVSEQGKLYEVRAFVRSPDGAQRQVGSLVLVQADGIGQAVEKANGDDWNEWLEALDATQSGEFIVKAEPTGRYIVSEGWGHIFVGAGEHITRFVLDRVEERLVIAQVAGRGARWDDLDRASSGDLHESLQHNEVLTRYAEFGDCTVMSTLPEWVYEAMPAGYRERVSAQRG